MVLWLMIPQRRKGQSAKEGKGKGLVDDTRPDDLINIDT